MMEQFYVMVVSFSIVGVWLAVVVVLLVKLWRA